MKMTLQETAHALKSVGDLNGLENNVVTAVQTDSRLVRQGDLFICINGERFDGHNFAGQARDNGAIALVSHKPMPEMSIPVLLVSDTVEALGRLGAYWRHKNARHVIAITGSAGKTTTREMIWQTLAQKYNTGRNFKNWNNQIGLPLSILNLGADEDYWVLELGINNDTDMDELARIASPDTAVLLNVGPCHLEGLKSVENVANCKAKLLDYLQGPQNVIASSDYPFLVKEVASRLELKPAWISSYNINADYMVSYLGRGMFEVNGPDGKVIFQGSDQWSQYCENIAACWAVATLAGLNSQEIIQGVQNFQPPEQRFTIKNLADWTIIDDTYNANPLSMSRAIHSTRSMAGDRNLFLVLGDMAELGDLEASAHVDLGREISKTCSSGIFFYGRNKNHVLQGLAKEHAERFFALKSQASFRSALNSLAPQGGVILFKGSRSASMEQFLTVFKDWLADASKSTNTESP